MNAESQNPRLGRLQDELRTLVADDSGLDLAGVPDDSNFVDLGLDSLFMTQFAITVQQKYGVKISFRELLGDLSSIAALATRLDSAMPAEVPDSSQTISAETSQTISAGAGAGAGAAGSSQTLSSSGAASSQTISAVSSGTSQTTSAARLEAVIDQQLRLMAAQLELLSRGRVAAAKPAAQTAAAQTAAAQPAAPPPATQPVAPPPTQPAAQSSPAPAVARPASAEDEAHTRYDVKKAFGAIARIHTARDHHFSPVQQARFDAFVRRYTSRTAHSKSWTQKHRANMADPRVVSGFKPHLKEIVYPIVVERSKGAHLWDLDGNKYVDVLNGFGSNFFGYQPDFVADALKAQIDTGYDVGPQTPLAGEAADLVCEMTGFDRAGFCNTGSEAVLGCMRVARTVTGKKLIAMFTGAYHGIFDEVLSRATKKGKSVPAAPGVMQSAVENILLLDYGTPESLAILKARANELAAVLVEPIQSRRPDFQPKEFLQEVRKLTQDAGAALIFDEVITGFRMGPGGAQEYYGIRADLASYGKVVGGGLSIGIVAGKREWVDALDGGQWQFGDDSGPTVGVTYFAGTFVRHPLAMAACLAALKYMKKHGPQLQANLNERTTALTSALNEHFREVGAPIELRGFSSLWKPFWTSEQPFGELLFAMLRDRGVHIWDGFPCFLTLAHSDDDLAWIARAFQESIAEMQDGGFLPPRTKPSLDENQPPVPGARLGRDPDGMPAWYVPHPDQPGQYMKLERA
ncbi:MAG TPA: aminotransferase class III-fold pyridoxal phosphate-dependent enzyme [Myxococcales bacterium]